MCITSPLLLLINLAGTSGPDNLAPQSSQKIESEGFLLSQERQTIFSPFSVEPVSLFSTGGRAKGDFSGILRPSTLGSFSPQDSQKNEPDSFAKPHFLQFIDIFISYPFDIRAFRIFVLFFRQHSQPELRYLPELIFL